MYEIDFLPVGDGNGDAICLRHGDADGFWLHVVDGGFTDTADTIIKHLRTHYGKDAWIHHMVVSHGDNDHVAGLVGVMEALDVKNLWMNRPWLYVDEVMENFHGNYTKEGLLKEIKDRHEFQVRLEELAIKRKIPIWETFQGAKIGVFTVLAPTRQRYIKLIPDMDKTPTNYADAAKGIFAKAFEAAAKAAAKWLDEAWDIETLSSSTTYSASNESSVVQWARIDEDGILLTGDAGPEALNEAADYGISSGLVTAYPKFVQVPHHGSRQNATPAILDRWLGKRMAEGGEYGIAFCSVGKTQTDYPRGQVVNAFHRRGYPVHATKGNTKHHYRGYPARPGWVASAPEPFATKVEA